MPPGWIAYAHAAGRETRLPAYARFLSKQAGLPVMRDSRQPQQYPTGARFANSVVETFDPARLRTYLTDDEWKCVECIVSMDAFRAAVMPDYDKLTQRAQQPRSSAPASSRLPAELVADLYDKNYVERPATAAQVQQLNLCPCLVFAVVKSDGTSLRLIWNGKEFNLLINTPPHFVITQMPEMLQRLLRPDVAWYLAFDFQTWFLQLIVADGIKWLFGTVLAGQLCRLKGVPMGLAWACVIAHALTVGFTRAVMQELGNDSKYILTAEFCIDNTIYAVSKDAPFTPDQLYATVKRVAQKMNIALKDSATESGTRVEWLVYVLDAEKRKASFKPAYIQRLESARALARSSRPRTTADLWAMLGLVIFTCYAARWPLTRAAHLVDWLAAHAPPTEAAAVPAWGRSTPEFPHGRLAHDLLQQAAGATVDPPPPLSRGTHGPWAVTDASTSGNEVACVFRGDHVHVRIVRRGSGPIHVLELSAALMALEKVLDEPAEVAERGVPLYIDNDVARAALERGWALWADAAQAARLEGIAARLEQLHASVLPVRVDTTRCIADAGTRRTTTGDDVPEQTFTITRTCAHDRHTVCPCVDAEFEARHLPCATLRAWREQPPWWPAAPTAEAVRTPMRSKRTPD